MFEQIFGDSWSYGTLNGWFKKSEDVWFRNLIKQKGKTFYKLEEEMIICSDSFTLLKRFIKIENSLEESYEQKRVYRI